ncbi:MAG: PP2C family protein-serine/threonine phosphatase [Thermoanaerobaculia bacterium]
MARLGRIQRLLLWGLTAMAALLALVLLLAQQLMPEVMPWFLRLSAQAFLVALVLVLALWLVWIALRRFLWRVGRKLAFSYFLIGVLPIPMVLLLAGLNVYLLSGYFLGHLYRGTVQGLETELQAAADVALAGWSGGSPPALALEDVRLAYYRRGSKVAGAAAAPAGWPGWISAESTAPLEGPVAYAALVDGSPTLAAASSRDSLGVLALSAEGTEQLLTRRSGIWVELLRAEEQSGKDSLVRVQLFGEEFRLMPISGAKRTLADRESFFGVTEPDPGWVDRPMLWWGEVSGALRSLDDGAVVADYLAVSLNSNLRTIRQKLSSSSGEVDTAVWAGLVAVTGMLSTVYAVAVLTALWIILGLSLAVNRLSRATNAVQRGDFSVRIGSHRRDQIGELESTFDEMTANLEMLVDAAARQELVHKELEIARDLQQSLLPSDLPASEAMEFATLFEPSAAIGGDYFDVLRVDDDRLAVVVADVSGHGLPTGLRMAMLKAALVILVEERKPAEEILRRLNGMVRAEKRQRFFVTATIAVIDFRHHRLQITNAGHPPSYRLRDGIIEEILLTGSPLGALGDDYGRRDVELAPGDVLIWLSDGLIEAADEAGEPFGYDRTQEALAGSAESATAVRNRLLAAVHEHTGGRPPDDDRTLVVMRYRPAAAVSAAPAPASPRKS